MITLRTFGAVELRRVDNGDATPIRAQPKRLAALAYLAAASGTPQRRDLLLALLWPEMDAYRARRALSQTLYTLRRDLGADALVSRGNEEVQLEPGALWCDAAVFMERVEGGELDRALDLYRGDFLPGLHVAGAGEFERWVDRARHGYRTAALSGALRLAGEGERHGDGAATMHWLSRALEIAPSDEAVFRRLLASLHAAGERSRALGAYEAFARRLRDDYGLAPGAETLDLVEAIRRDGDGRRPASVPSSSGDAAASVRAAGAAGNGSRADRALTAVAVLPLRNLTGAAGEDYLADGIAEALTMELGRIAALRVISYQSVIRFRGSDRPLGDIAAELGVAALVQGSVSRSGSRLRVAIQMCRAEPEAIIWAESYDRDLGGLPGIYGDVACSVGHAVRATLSDAERRALARRTAVDPETYKEYLKGRYFAFMLPDVEKAVGCFRRAIDRDPTFAPAYAGLATMAAHLCIFVHLPPDDSRAHLESAVRRALELDDTLSEAYVAQALGHLLFDYDWDATVRAFRRALELNPSDSRARAYCGAFLTAMGWSEAGLEQTARAVSLDPFDPSAAWLHGWAQLKARRFDAAAETLRDVLEMHPQFGLALPFLAEACLHRGEHEAAQSWALRAIETLSEDQVVLGRSAAVLGLAGAPDAARAARARLDALHRDRYVDPYLPALAASALDDPELAVAGWRSAIEGRTASAYCLKADALTERVQEHPGFQSLLRSLDFPDVDRQPAPPLP